MNKNNIRNFVVIAHIDHGKSTLADRFLEITKTIEGRDMKEQYLDQMELERERGITVKMAPVQMRYDFNDSEYVLNLIDTPGHSDFSYEVSRALTAVEGAVLLIDGTQGIQAQTVYNYRLAKKLGLKIIGAVNKIDLLQNDPDRLDSHISDVANLLDVDSDEIFKISAKNGDGVEDLLRGVIKEVEPPEDKGDNPRSLIFDSFYDKHKGVVAGTRIFGGEFSTGDDCILIAADKKFRIKEMGHFIPELQKSDSLTSGDVGYIATGIKDPGSIKIGDTVTKSKLQKTSEVEPLPGYQEPKPVVYVSFYPESNDKYDDLGKAFEKLRLNDSALVIKNDRNEILGRGYKVGFLGKLHFEITEERIREEFGINVLNTLPSVVHKIKTKKGWKKIIRPEKLPENFEEIHEPVVDVEVLIPPKFLNNLLSVQQVFRMKDIEVETVGDLLEVRAKMPLSELIENFDETLKSISEGYGSFGYEFAGFEKSDVVRVDFLVSKEIIPGLSRFISKEKHESEARNMVKKLKDILPKKQYSQPVQAKAGGRVIAREDIPAIRKDVTEGLYGGDYSRKKKQLKKQREGKKKLKKMGQAEIDPEAFKELLKK